MRSISPRRLPAHIDRLDMVGREETCRRCMSEMDEAVDQLLQRTHVAQHFDRAPPFAPGEREPQDRRCRLLRRYLWTSAARQSSSDDTRSSRSRRGAGAHSYTTAETNQSDASRSSSEYTTPACSGLFSSALSVSSSDTRKSAALARAGRLTSRRGASWPTTWSTTARLGGSNTGGEATAEESTRAQPLRPVQRSTTIPRSGDAHLLPELSAETEERAREWQSGMRSGNA